MLITAVFATLRSLDGLGTLDRRNRGILAPIESTFPSPGSLGFTPFGADWTNIRIN
jgi:hypothetical protein